MSKLLRRPTRTIACFYCQTEQQPRDLKSFRCAECTCWNRYDRNGEIMSDDPAMHDESLNVKSFARRASSRKDRLPSMYSQHGQSLFCHTCQTNQMLISNLLSNYLPSHDDPDYNRLLSQLPAYQASLETRYPPICADCLPAVEEEIKRRDNMARTSALGGFLKESKGKGKQRQVLDNQGKKEALERQLVIWRVRGALWVVSVAVVLTTYGAVAADYVLPRVPWVIQTCLPIIELISITWAAWDPTYASLKRSQLQGRTVRQRGKKEYNILQSLSWLSRLMTTLLIAISLHKPTWDLLHLRSYNPSVSDFRSRFSQRALWYFRISLAYELIILARSLYVLRIDRPPPVRLMQQFSYRPSLSSATSSRQSTPIIESPPDMFSALTLSNKPVLPGQHQSNVYARPESPKHVFGITSLASAAHITEPHESMMTEADMNAMDEDDAFDNDNDNDNDGDRDPNAMDWSPIAPAKRQPVRRSLKMIGSISGQQQQVTRKMGQWNDGNWLRPQRFFVPEEPTGLEGLFEQTISLSDDARANAAKGQNGKGGRDGAKGRWLGLEWVKGRWKSE